jgi:hypothetical protein
MVASPGRSARFSDLPGHRQRSPNSAALAVGSFDPYAHEGAADLIGAAGAAPAGADFVLTFRFANWVGVDRAGDGGADAALVRLLS